MALTIDELFGTATPAEFLAKIDSVATIIGLVPSNWVTTGIASVLYQTCADLLGLDADIDINDSTDTSIDRIATQINMSGFLDSAAEVTPEGGYGWLDILGDSTYNETRIGATKAFGPVILHNTGGQRGPFAAGTYHLVNSSLGKTYTNTEDFTIATGTSDTTVNFEADEAGSASTTVADQLTPVTSLVGVTVKTGGGANSNTLTGTDAQTNAKFVAQCRGHLQALGPKLGPNGAYVYFATNTSVEGYPTLGVVIDKVGVVLDPLSGNVDVYLAAGITPVSGGDLTAIDDYLQAVVVPDGQIATVQGATPFNIDVQFAAFCPTADIADVTAGLSTAISDYFAALDLGGVTGSVQGFQRSAFIAYLFEKVANLQNVTTLTLNGSSGDLTMSAYDLAIASPSPTFTVTGTG